MEKVTPLLPVKRQIVQNQYLKILMEAAAGPLPAKYIDC